MGSAQLIRSFFIERNWTDFNPLNSFPPYYYFPTWHADHVPHQHFFLNGTGGVSGRAVALFLGGFVSTNRWLINVGTPTTCDPPETLHVVPIKEVTAALPQKGTAASKSSYGDLGHDCLLLTTDIQFTYCSPVTAMSGCRNFYVTNQLKSPIRGLISR